MLANELKNNACKLAKWTVQSILAGADNLKFGYVTRYNVKDSSRHVILGTQQFKPIEFGQQINLSMDNAWGIVRWVIHMKVFLNMASLTPRCVLDLVMAQKDGKYLIVKDPNKPMIRFALQISAAVITFCHPGFTTSLTALLRARRRRMRVKKVGLALTE